jgi:hypothetical protein
MKKITAAFILALLLLGATEARAQCAGPKRVTFQRGTTTAILKGAVGASKAVCYQIRARAGQRMIVQLTSPTRRARFTVIPDGYDVEPLAGAQDVTSWQGVLDETSDYTISVSAPRAGDTYTLEVTIPSTARAGASQRVERAPCGNFAGVYGTQYGPLRLTRTGAQVRGIYTTEEGLDGTLTGTVRGNVLTGRWKEPGTRGTFRFTLDPDGRSFTGSFASDAEPNEIGEWGGTCVEVG